MNVHRLLTNLSDCIKYRESKRDIRDEDTIHNIHVEPIGLTFVNHFNLLIQIKEVSRE